LTPDEIAKLTRFLRTKFELASLIVRKRPQRKGLAEVFIGDEQIGKIEKDEEDGELSYSFSMDIDNPPAEIIKVGPLLQAAFDLPKISVRAMPRKKDSAEVYIGDEFIGLIYRDEEGGVATCNFTMSILDFDLE
jgi:hypothetical protein